MAKKTDKAAEATVAPEASQDDPKAAETTQTTEAAQEDAKATDASANSEAPQGDPKVAESAQAAQDEPAGEVTAETVPDGMVAVEFLRGYVVKDHHEGTDKQTSYAEGEVVVLSEASAQHFISRGAAKEV